MKLRVALLSIALFALAAASTTASAAPDRPGALGVSKPCQNGTRTVRVNGKRVRVCRTAKPQAATVPPAPYPLGDGACYGVLRPGQPC